jgi:hypothetical protein
MATKELISTITVGAGGAANITFSSIPQTYTDLSIVYSIRINSGSIWDSIPISFNGNTTGTSYTFRDTFGTGTTRGSNAGSIYTILVSGNQTYPGAYSTGSIYIPSYTESKSKAYFVDAIAEDNTSSILESIVSGKWSSTAAITSIAIYSSVNNLMQYSTASLYGFNKGTGGASVA